MPEPLTLAAAGGVILAEGIKFLYGQAAEALKRWHERRETASEPAAKTVLSEAAPPLIFEGQLAPLEIHLDRLALLEDHLLELRRALSNYADGLEPIDPNDQQMLETVNALRETMEAVYQQRLTFKGEQRVVSGPVVEGVIDVNTVAGTAAAVEARLIASGKVVGKGKAERVETGGALYGVKVDRIE